MYKYGAKLLRVVDGDTADVMIDLGFSTWVKARLRFKGVDTWEKRTRDLEEKKKGIAASEFTKKHLELNDGKFVIQSYGKGKYGRVLAEIFVNIDGEETSLNKLLIENGHAYEYEGGKKQLFKG
jgi:micrococcal nuclease